MTPVSKLMRSTLPPPFFQLTLPNRQSVRELVHGPVLSSVLDLGRGPEEKRLRRTDDVVTLVD